MTADEAPFFELEDMKAVDAGAERSIEDCRLVVAAKMLVECLVAIEL